jgi:hypothetical protein
MDRGQIVVGAIVVAAVALFGLKIWSDRTPPEDALLSRGRGSQLAFREGGGRASEGGDWAAGTESGVGSGSRPGAPYRRFGGSRAGQPGVVGSDARGRAGARAVEVLRGADRRGKGFVGRSGSGARSHLRGDSSVAVGDEPSTEHFGPRPKQHDELVDFLGAQPPTRDQVFGGTPSADPGGDVVLEVNSVQDSEQAVDAQNVQPAQDGVGLDLSSDSVLAFPNAGNANGDAGSISFDIDPQWTGSDQTDNSLVQIRTPNGWDNRMQLVKNGRYLRFILTDNTGRESDISVPIDQWTPGQPHTVTSTWGDGKTTLYIDGQQVGQNTYKGSFLIPPNTPMYVGSDLPGGSYAGANATIQNFKVFGRALAPNEVN